MTCAVAEAEAAEAESPNVFGAWSDLVVGQQPQGLVETYLLQRDDPWQVVSVWHDARYGASNPGGPYKPRMSDPTRE